ncbi:hypothetical protein ACJ72_05940 [Emergomyces africanus]|uniref:C2H2-type domain-containing protein n=1 Tax=Emergomyces africanus TaxID=1955775 RepID=A0A1B7NSH4_9EURO|nr:hypothetical protein ACJ72_05940 [Emergomyces africanus]
MTTNGEGSSKDRMPDKSAIARGKRSFLSSLSDLTSASAEQDQRSMTDSTKADSRVQQIWAYQFHLENYTRPREKINANKSLAASRCQPNIYICIANGCTDSHPQFPELDDWLNHMQGHGHRWYQEVFHMMSWVCLLCTPSLKFYTYPEHLLARMKNKPSGERTEEDLEIISRNSSRREPTPSKCRLCQYEIRKTAPLTHLSSRKRRKQPLREMEGKRARADLEMSHPKTHISIDDPSLDFDGRAESFDSVEGSPASTQNYQEAIEYIDDDSADADIDGSFSQVEDLAMLSNIDLQNVNEEEEPLRRIYPTDPSQANWVEREIPGAEIIRDWEYIPRRYVTPEEDKFLEQLVKSDVFQ